MTGAHLYTEDENEVTKLLDSGSWQSDYFGFPIINSGGNKDVYRLYNDSLRMHHFTAEPFEYSVLNQNGWTPEGSKIKAVK